MFSFSITKAIETTLNNNNTYYFNQSYVANYNKGFFFIFPFTYYETDIYLSIMIIPFTIFVTTMFIYPIIRLLSLLIVEKSNKIREGMQMMGLKLSIYWLSMFLWFIFKFSLIGLLITGFGFLMNVFKFPNPIIITLWFWLFCLSQMSFSTLISTLFDNPKTSIMVGFVLYFILMGLGILMNIINKLQKNVFCLLATPCMMHSLNILTIYENAMIGIQWDNINDDISQFSFRNVLIMLFMDCIVYTLLTIYFDNVLPSRYGSKKSYFLFISILLEEFNK